MLSEMFTRVKVALVLEGKDIVNIITRIDLIDYMAARNR